MEAKPSLLGPHASQIPQDDVANQTFFAPLSVAANGTVLAEAGNPGLPQKGIRCAIVELSLREHL